MPAPTKGIDTRTVGPPALAAKLPLAEEPVATADVGDAALATPPSSSVSEPVPQSSSPPVEEPPVMGGALAAEPAPLPEAPPETVAVASPVREAPPIHADVTIRGWFSDVFNNLVATGRVREREAESYLQDLLGRLGL